MCDAERRTFHTTLLCFIIVTIDRTSYLVQRYLYTGIIFSRINPKVLCALVCTQTFSVGVGALSCIFAT